MSADQPTAQRLWRPALLLAALFFLGICLRGQVWSGMGIDQTLYYAQLSSPLWDGDWALLNEVLEARSHYELRREMAENLIRDGRPNLPFSVGPAFFSFPFSWYARGLDGFTGWRLAWGDRFAWYYRAIPTFLAWTSVLGGLLASFAVSTRFTTISQAFLLVSILFLGTNVCYYTWNEPGMAHAWSFGAAAFVLWSAIRWQERPCLARAFLAGLAVGAAFLIRWQELLLALIPFAAWCTTLRRQGIGPTFAQAAMAIAAAASMALPQIALWRVFFGQWLLAPQGESFFILDWSRPALVLFAPLNGWIYTHPLVGLLLLGLVAVARRQSPAWLGGSVGVVLLLGILVNSLPGDWWAGGSFGGRRFVGLQALLVIPGALALRCAGPLGNRLLLATGGILVLLNLLAVSRWTLMPQSAFFWSEFLATLPQTLEYLTSSSSSVFSSDLFTRPQAVDRYDRVRLYFLMACSTWGLIALFICYVTKQDKHLLLARILALGIPLYAIGWSIWALQLPMPGREAAIAWNAVSQPLLVAQENEDELRASAPGFAAIKPPHHSPAALYRLELALIGQDYGEAARLSAALEPHWRRAVLDIWTFHARRGAPLRRAWIERLVPEPDAPPSTLQALHIDAVRLEDEEQFWPLHDRLGGPSWERARRAFDQAYWTMAPSPELRAALHQMMERNPYWMPAWVEMIRLRQNEDRAEKYLNEMESLISLQLSPARWVAKWQPDAIAAFEPGWRPAVVWRYLAQESLGAVERAEGDLQAAAALGLEAGAVLSLRKRLERARAYEQLLAGEQLMPPGADGEAPPSEFPPGAIATAPTPWIWKQDGWTEMEINGQRTDTWRWTNSEIAFIRLSAPIPEGDYVVKLNGWSFRGPRFQRTLKADFYGQDRQEFLPLPQGRFHAAFGIQAWHDLPRPLLRLHTPTLPLDQYYTDIEDDRQVGFLLNDLWIEPAPPGEEQ